MVTPLVAQGRPSHLSFGTSAEDARTQARTYFSSNAICQPFSQMSQSNIAPALPGQVLNYELFSLVFSLIKSSENSILGGEPTIPQEKMGCKKFKKKYGIERFLTNESKESIFEKNNQLLVGPQASFLRPLFRPSSHDPGEGVKKISPGNCADLHFRSPRKKMQKKSIRLVE